MAWESAEKVQKNAAGEYRAMIGGEWVPVAKAQKSASGQYRIDRGDGSSVQPGKTYEELMRQVTDDMSGTEKFLAGTGKAFVDAGRGVGQLFGLGDRADIDESRRLDAALMDTGAGMAGNVVGNIAAYAPLAFVPGANTVAGGAALGALTGAVQPVGEGDSRLSNAAVGGVAGAVVPSAIKIGKTAKAALVDPFTEKGAQRIAGGVINRTAGNAQQAAQRMANAKGATPGFTPTAAQSADDAGIAALERATRAANPGAFDDIERSQREALANAVRGVAGDDVARNAAVQSRDSAANSLYGKAFESDSMRADLAREATQNAARTMSGGIQQAVKPIPQDLATPELRKLAMRPDFANAVNQAKTLAANKGVVLDDPLQSLEGLHYIKLALDDMANPIAGSPIGRNANAAINDMRSSLTDELAKVSPMYGNARQTFADMSKPINQMDIGQEYAKRLIPSLYRDMPAPQQLNAVAYARALTDQGDDIARNVTGMKGARLESVMSPEQLQSLRGVQSDLQMMKIGENAGRGVGSDTVQKTAMSHIAAQAGVPNWMADVARVPGGMLKGIGSMVYGRSDEKVNQLMAELLKNPQQAAQAMQAAGVNPSMISQLLQKGAQGLALSASPAMINQ